MTENCSIGKISSSDCNLLTYSKKVGLKDISLFDLQEREILAWRTEIVITLIETVCLHHEQVFLLRYSFLQKKCCDSFKVHGKKGSKSSLREITFQMAKVFQDNHIPVVPGQKLCPKCRIKFSDLHDNDLSGEVQDDTSSDEIHDNDDSFHKESYSIKAQGKDNVKASDFLVSYYDDHVWIGIACYIDEANGDIEVKFMHPAFPSKSFHWPRREDKCFVPVTNVVCVIKAPTTSSGRQYYFTDNEHILIQAEINKYETLKHL
eukprot:gene6844-12439_t